MSLGMPPHLVPVAVVRSATSGLSAAALVHIAVAAIAVLVMQASDPQLRLWPGLVPLAGIAALMLRYIRTRARGDLAVMIAAGVVCVYAFAVIFHSQPDAMRHVDGYIIALPALGLMLAPGVATRPGVPLLATIVAFLGGITVVSISALQHGAVIVPAVTPTGTLALVALIGMVAGLRGASRARRDLLRAQRDEQLASLRYNIEMTAAALMHDTVLNDLAALAAAPAGPLAPAQRAQMEHDLTLLLGEEWLSEEPEPGEKDPRADWQRSRLAAAIDGARGAGLQVNVSGDLTVLARLTRESSRALGLAVRQCLANVLQHSGTDRAEVAVYGTDSEVTVMVVDSGRGFSESETAADRMGLRHSVRTRVEHAGGAVRLWSTPGRGTSVMIRVPVEAPAAALGIRRRRQVAAP
ncbi:sensor histidine kinase [Lysobacter korlensis]|uniref:Sensor histidine kinase n=1 Tax=Lysobacter korlensis TaxID=553636 RepID=A0ABV6RZR1_9GAMM